MRDPWNYSIYDHSMHKIPHGPDWRSQRPPNHLEQSKTEYGPDFPHPAPALCHFLEASHVWSQLFRSKRVIVVSQPHCTCEIQQHTTTNIDEPSFKPLQTANMVESVNRSNAWWIFDGSKTSRICGCDGKSNSLDCVWKGQDDSEWRRELGKLWFFTPLNQLATGKQSKTEKVDEHKTHPTSQDNSNFKNLCTAFSKVGHLRRFRCAGRHKCCAQGPTMDFPWRPVTSW